MQQMLDMFPLYSSTGRPALNQPQILRSFILWFLLFQVLLQKLFFLIAVLPSLECGLIPKKKLVLSGDGTALYRKIYRNRTCIERVNNRILNDYGLHSLVVHSARRYSFIIMVIGICIHLDASRISVLIIL